MREYSFAAMLEAAEEMERELQAAEDALIESLWAEALASDFASPYTA